MDHENDTAICCIPGCNTDGSSFWAQDIAEPICGQHLAMASSSTRSRFETTLSRLAKIQSYWDDETKYDQIIASDRYLKLANATGWASETAEAAWHRVKLDVLKSCTNVQWTQEKQSVKKIAS